VAQIKPLYPKDKKKSKACVLLPPQPYDQVDSEQVQSFKGSKVKAVKWLRRVTNSYPNLFYHWGLGYKLV
jgi:uncharacterized protein with ParB-like and HNH nuclease domain